MRTPLNGRAMDKKYDLKWKSFNEHLVGVFRDLGEEGHFTDVTLVSDDQVQTRAHKIVLSACSPVLKNLLVNNPHSHPLLYLRGIKQSELLAILKFMYIGETQINEDRINDFVSLAKDLEIEEICEPQDVPEASEEVLRPDEVEDDSHNRGTEAEEKIIVKTENKEHKSLNTERTVSRARKQTLSNNDGKFPCDQCDYVAGQSSNLYTHRRSMHEGEMYNCL